MAFFAAAGGRVQVVKAVTSAGAVPLPDASRLFSPDPTDVVRFTRLRIGDTPERCLALAVMTQAILDLRRAPPGRAHGKEAGVYEKTRAWFRANDRAWPLSFASICELFDWSPGAVRAQVLGPEAEPADPEPARRLRLVRRRRPY